MGPGHGLAVRLSVCTPPAVRPSLPRSDGSWQPAQGRGVPFPVALLLHVGRAAAGCHPCGALRRILATGIPCGALRPAEPRRHSQPHGWGSNPSLGWRRLSWAVPACLGACRWGFWGHLWDWDSLRLPVGLGFPWATSGVGLVLSHCGAGRLFGHPRFGLLLDHLQG